MPKITLLKFILLSTVLAYFVFPCFLLAQEFPKSWEGHWEGTMQLSYSNGKTMAVHNELIIKDISTQLDSLPRFQWTIIYGEGTQRQERSYELLCQDPSTGKYLIDEKNSILLPAFFTDKTLISFFEVLDNYIMTTYRREGEFIYFENISSNSKSKQETGGEGEIPEVRTFGIANFQRAQLQKVK